MNLNISTLLFMLHLALTCGIVKADIFEFNGVAENETADHGYYYAVTGGLFPNRTGSPPTPNGDRASGTGVIMHIHDDTGIWGTRWYQDWDAGPIDGWFVDTSGLALTLSNGGAVVYDNNGIDDGSFAPDYYGDGNGGVSFSMANNYDHQSAGYFTFTSSTTFDSISAYFIGVSGFVPNDPAIAAHMNIFSASISDADPAPDPPLTYSPTVNSFSGDLLSTHAGVASFRSGSMSIEDSGVDIDVFGGTHDIYRATYSLDSAMTLDAGHYYFGHHGAIAVPEPISSFGLVSLAIGCLLSSRQRRP